MRNLSKMEIAAVIDMLLVRWGWLKMILPHIGGVYLYALRKES